MKIAILMVGHFRTFDKVKDTFVKNIIQANSDHQIDIYIHTWTSLGYSSAGIQTTDRDKEIHKKLTKKFGLSCHHDTNSPDLDEDMIRKILSPVKMVIETDDDLQKEVYDKLNTPKHSVSFYPNVYSHYRKVYLCNKLCQESGIKYDLVVKSRPDINYTKPILFNSMGPNVIVMQDHYVNDLLYYGPPEAITTVAEIFLKLNTNAPMDSHELLNYWIAIHNIRIHKIKLGIEIMRQNKIATSYE